MPRKPFVPTDLPYHISVRCINKDWFNAPLPEVWGLMNEKLSTTQILYNLKVHSFVLMNNHLHLIGQTPDFNISAAMNYFLRETSKSLLKSTNRINCTFNKRFFRSCLDTPHSFPICYKYVYRNPVEAGICQNVEDYQFSSLRTSLGLSEMRLRLETDQILNSNKEQTLNWLNMPPDKNFKSDVRKALKKESFQLKKVNKKPHPIISIGY